MTATDNGKGAAPAAPPLVLSTQFGFWLDQQRHRQDRTGAVARFVIEDLEKGCWPDSTHMFIYYKRTDEEQRGAWVNHLLAEHDPACGAISVFREVHAEYVAAWESYQGWCAAEWERRGRQSFDLYDSGGPGQAEALKAVTQFWRRITEAQGRPRWTSSPGTKRGRPRACGPALVWGV